MAMANGTKVSTFISLHLATRAIFPWSEAGAEAGSVTSAPSPRLPAHGRLDTNGDGVLNCAVDTCVTSFGQPGDFPVTREMGGTSGSIIGTYTPANHRHDKRAKDDQARSSGSLISMKQQV